MTSSTPRTDHRLLLHDLDLSGQIDHDLYDLVHVAGWHPYNLHDLAHVFCVGDLYYTDPAQHLKTEG